MERMVSRHGCQINGQDRRGKTALYCAAETNDVHSLKSLLRLDASPTVVDGNSFTPLYISLLPSSYVQYLFSLLSITIKKLFTEVDANKPSRLYRIL